LLAKAIAATQEGKAPPMPRLYPHGKVRTYVHETVIRAPADGSLDDPRALADFGRRAANVFIELDQLPPPEREKATEARIRELLHRETVS
jgi:hypothetical protein